jgi:anti-sigma B factor antagonist
MRKPSQPLVFIDWEVEGVVVLTLIGRLVLGDATAAFRETIHALVDKGKLRVLLNMKEVHHIDSSGLAELVSAYTTLKHRGGRLKLMNLNPAGESLMQLTRLYTVFEVFHNEDEAIRSFTR